ncbi:alkaline phosphatase [Streptomyces tateyamensis]|uniref:Alkaline phosphatase n=1 Tax=Streptomyces tateyamensis TaxID=565073 RepID=A0A2V4P349_9ACTN|nr:DeoR/GlpR family DNA-binding transcription regulator [Streptomyces tateyamensis]PYC78698.1 alkaline phosphatase [Streptomyces tateyamensis]
MTTHTRRARLLELLGDRHRIDVNEAARQLGVSAATVRRDLRELANRQLLVRTHGGALPSGVSHELPLRHKSTRRAEDKLRIAQAAAALVPAGAVVGLNGGSTTTEVARELAARPDLMTGGRTALTVVTNAINIAAELAVRPHIRTVVTGGLARPTSYELTGLPATLVLEHVSLDYAVLGVAALDPEAGAATAEESEAQVNRVMANRARTVVVVADSGKLGRRAFATFCPPHQIDLLLTDTRASDTLVSAFQIRGIPVQRC